MVGTNTNNSDASRCGRGRRQGTRHSHRSDAVHQRATPGTAALNPRRGPWQRSNTWARDQRLTPNQASRTRRRQGSAQLRPTPGSQEAHRDRHRPESISASQLPWRKRPSRAAGPTTALPTSPPCRLHQLHPPMCSLTAATPRARCGVSTIRTVLLVVQQI
jgi:hypothetical protein